MFNVSINVKKIILLILITFMMLLGIKTFFGVLALPIFLENTKESINIWQTIYLSVFGILILVLSYFLLSKKYVKTSIYAMLCLLFSYIFIPYIFDSSYTPLQNYFYYLAFKGDIGVRIGYFLMALCVYKLIKIENFYIKET